MKLIKLTQDQVAVVDDYDYERFGTLKWYARWDHGTQSFYALRSSLWTNGKRRFISMHREIMNAKTGEYIDHINHDTLDNRCENLRLCSASQNQANRRKQVNNTSGFRGVSFHQETGKWRAQLRCVGKPLHIGLFITAIDAALAYDRAAFDTFDEFALTNKMLGLIPDENVLINIRATDQQRDPNL